MYIVYDEMDSNPVASSPFSRRTEKCAQLTLQTTVFSHCSHMEIWTLFLRRSVADSGCDDFGHFCCIFAAFSGSSSELSPRVSAQALALVSVTCIVVVRLWSYTFHLVNPCQKQRQQQQQHSLAILAQTIWPMFTAL